MDKGKFIVLNCNFFNQVCKIPFRVFWNETHVLIPLQISLTPKLSGRRAFLSEGIRAYWAPKLPFFATFVTSPDVPLQRPVRLLNFIFTTRFYQALSGCVTLKATFKVRFNLALISALFCLYSVFNLAFISALNFSF